MTYLNFTSQGTLFKPIAATLLNGPQRIYRVNAAIKPLIDPVRLRETTRNGEEMSWKNSIRFARAKMAERGWVVSPEPGTWALTDQGRHAFYSGAMDHRTQTETHHKEA